MGNSRWRSVNFVNTGGAGRFLVLPAHEWVMAQAAEQQQQQQQQVSTHAGGSSRKALLADQVSTAQDSPAACYPDKAAAAAAAAASEPATVLAASSPAVSGPFSLAPAFLDLSPGASGRLNVTFSPDRPGQHTGEFVLICDNCTVRPLRLLGTGSQVDIKLVGLDGRQLEQEDGQAPVWFGQVSGCQHE